MNKVASGLFTLILITTIPAAHAACVTHGGSGGEASLQVSLDSVLGANAPNVSTACVPEGSDAGWSFDGPKGSASILLEFAGFANQNSFGLYDLSDKTRKLELFSGSDGAGAGVKLNINDADGDGDYRFAVVGDGAKTFATEYFGFYLKTPENGGKTWYSDTSLNADGTDHMMAFEGSGSKFVKGPLETLYFKPGDYLLAWEDLKNGGDFDYQDFVVMVKGITPTAVPLPAAAWLLLSGLFGIGLLGRRKKATLAA